MLDGTDTALILSCQYTSFPAEFLIALRSENSPTLNVSVQLRSENPSFLGLSESVTLPGVPWLPTDVVQFPENPYT